VGRWTKTAEKPSEQTFELRAYSTAVVQNESDTSEAQRRLQHAKEQLDLAWKLSISDQSEPGREMTRRPSLICSKKRAKPLAPPSLLVSCRLPKPILPHK
jgi:hypothetical protein